MRHAVLMGLCLLASACGSDAPAYKAPPAPAAAPAASGTTLTLSGYTRVGVKARL